METNDDIKVKSEGYSIFVLYDGYSSTDEKTNTMQANCTCTLITGPYNIIVDTMTPWDKEKILIGLKKHNMTPDEINYVICTHGHSDHIGNNNLFLNAIHIVGLSVSRKDTYYTDAFSNGSKYHIDDCIEIIPTPGHTLSDVSVIAKINNQYTYAITGDLFERAEDIDDPSIWLDAGSESPDQQRRNRFEMAKIADWIVPGHGPLFCSTAELRDKLKIQMDAS